MARGGREAPDRQPSPDQERVGLLDKHHRFQSGDYVFNAGIIGPTAGFNSGGVAKLLVKFDRDQAVIGIRALHYRKKVMDGRPAAGVEERSGALFESANDLVVVHGDFDCSLWPFTETIPAYNVVIR